MLPNYEIISCKPLSCAAGAEGAQFPVVDVEAGGAGEGDEEVAQVDETQHPLGERHQVVLVVLGLKYEDDSVLLCYSTVCEDQDLIEVP